MLQITPISAFADNYIWVCYLPDSQFCLVVDPGDASVVQHFLQQNGKTLGAILITHHHNDHIGGLAALRQDLDSLACQPPTTAPVVANRSE